MKSSWKARVYHLPRKKDKFFKLKKWFKIRESVFVRDGWTCQMCKNEYFGDNLDLTAHHIKPRKKGGSNKLSNLISLCNSCHNIAELEELSKKEILSYDLDSIQINNNNIAISTDWHKWVYGAYSKPQ